MVLGTYGRSTGFCIDPIEKKPLNHFYPGTSVLSFGTAGCNLGCKFCQNWSISKSREVEQLSELATPEAIAAAALQHGCRSVAFTYNDPVIWAEYAIDVARACREVGVKTVAVTAGYITPIARGPFYEVMDAANVDLKGFTEHFYQHLTLSHLEPVLDTLKYLRHETDVWFEITNLIIPRENDSHDELRQMCEWILEALGDDVPTHFTAFHPDFRLRDRPGTPLETLLAAHEIARQCGLKHPYVGNVNDVQHQSTYCPHCGGLVIERDWYQLGRYHLDGNRCRHCGGTVAGHFEAKPGNWGRRREPVQIARFQRPLPVVEAPRPIAIQPQGNAMNITVESPPDAPATLPATFTAEQERLLHHTASELVAAAILNRPARIADPTLGGMAGWPLMGTFVSLKRKGRLRSCCGSMGHNVPLGEALPRAAWQSATSDMRLPPISASELRFLDLEVWLLHTPRRMTARGADRIGEVNIGRHGLQIRRGEASGLLLPSVAIEHQVDAEGFLQMVAMKAGLPPTAWKEDDVELGIFEGHAIHAPFDPTVLTPQDGQPFQLLSEQHFRQYYEVCRDNIVKLLQGAVPTCYLPDCPDATVTGLVVSLRRLGHPQAFHFCRMSLRPGLPLQGSLLGLCESAVAAIRQQLAAGTKLDNMQLDLSLLYDTAMHGTAAEPALEGFDPRRRALLLFERSKWSCVFDPTRIPQEVVETACREARVAVREEAVMYSVLVQTSASPLVFASVPQAQGGPRVRPPAVAGSFYPADAGELTAIVDKFLAGDPPQRKPWAAVMVPHAGLIFSGKLAANVLRHVEIPDTVVIISPKHTPHGAEWAVAPHETWSLPGIEIANDLPLAQQLAKAIPGLELDAVAHQGEHGIEVELPFVHRLAPQARVVGIAIGAGSLQRCREFATGLASILRDRPGRVLLVISSDMNHYASDVENRRLDAMALKCLEQLDAEELLMTCQKHHISMCGVLPAVIVLETLKQLGKLNRAESIGYATSGDVTGDRSRVVGYAGMAFGT